ncbi:hypothetical protein LOD99_8116 [Oopsacas minuta]|uniref:Uncharacterized protein n=1 Tax=Oopsacas minuta TaxID=111878 RepID=A0AAV7JJ48_9METZ|nr:hypothetical protein LOD99_8116 [Oopsacas minuta]
MFLRLNTQILSIIILSAVLVLGAETRGYLELQEVILTQCNNTRVCKVSLNESEYILTKNVYLDNKTLDSLELIGVGYKTRVICDHYTMNEHAKNNTMISIYGLEEVYFYQLHFHNCHPARIIPMKIEVKCPINFLPGCPTEGGVRKSTVLPEENKMRKFEKFEFGNDSSEGSHHKLNSNNVHKVNATIWIKNCKHIHIEYVSFNNFSYNAIQITDSKNTNLTSVFLYGKSSRVATGYHARGVLYEITDRTHQYTDFTLNITKSFLEDIATVSHDIEFNLSGSNTISDIDDHYGGGGIKISIMSAVESRIQITRCYFKSCVALQGSGILLLTTEKVQKYQLVINNSKFERNKAFIPNLLNPSGGAIMIKQRSDNGNITITNSVFKSNCANQGGAIGLNIQENNIHHIVLHSQNNLFSCNNANLGGALYIENNFQKVNEFKFKETNFTKNIALTGGAILGFNSNIKIINSTLSLNKGNLGGAIALISSLLSFEDNTSISNNSAELKGGAIYMTAYSKIHVRDYAYVLIKGNVVKYKGGGIFVFNQYEEYTYGDWSNHMHLLEDIFCFITFGETKGLMLDFQDNSIKLHTHSANTNTPCMGPDLFANTWGACLSKRKRFSLMHTNSTNLATNNKETNCSVALDISRYEKLDFINESLCYFNSFNNRYQPYCHTDTIDIDSFPNYKRRLKLEAKKAINRFIGQIRIPSKVYVIYPGFETSITIASIDSQNQSILTDTVIQFEQTEQNTKHEIKFKFGEILTDSIVTPSSTRVYFSLTNSIDDWVHGKLCLKSKLSMNIINYCIPIILSKCMPGFELEENRCQVMAGSHIAGVKGTNVTTDRNVMMVVRENEDTDVFDYVHCTWFQCKCDSIGSVENCTFNILKPQDQCKDWLKGKYCTESKIPNHTVAPTYSFFHLLTDRYSFQCRAPWLMLILYFIICAGILAVIMLARIDIFADYTRSITFYSGILFLMTLSCGDSGDEFFQKLITIPIVVLNLKVTHMYRFCSSQTNAVNQAIFELYAPLIFVFYTAVIFLSAKYFSNRRIMKIYRIDHRIIISQFLTALILLYTNLCSGAFLVFKCPQDSNKSMRWVLNSNIICFQGEHAHLSIAAIFILYLLSVIPFLLITMSCTDMAGKDHLVSIYEKKYNINYKHWEPIKMFLRFGIAMLLILPSEFDTFTYPCVIVSVICLLLMIANSLLQPSINSCANHFESLCLLVLAFTGIRVSTQFNEEFSSLLLTLPFCIFLVIKGSKLIIICVRKVKGKWRKKKIDV